MMGRVDIDPLHALSCARTALDDPAALPTSEETRVRAIGAHRFQCPPIDSARATYVIEQIDAALAVLHLDPIEDAGLEAQVPLSALRSLVIDVADELEAVDAANRAIPHLRSAAASLSDALAVLHS
jgi:hypothetical protein